MNPTDILLSIAIVGIYTLIYVYLKSKYDENKSSTSKLTFWNKNKKEKLLLWQKI